MMTMHRLGAGDGYRYLTNQVAKGDGAKVAGGNGKAPDPAVDYYLQTGNPAGRWMGSGIEALGVEGRVETRQMHNLYGLGVHPDTGVQLGRKYLIYRSIRERVDDRVDELTAKLGRAPSEAERGAIEREEKAKGEKQAVAGFDLVFSPVKSVSLAWALGDEWTAGEVEAAHHAAVAHVIATIEHDVAFARVGAGGVAQVDVDGVAVAAFDHRTSRAGDPDLHTHAVVSNKVRARLPGGGTKWLTLDSQAMYKAAVAMSERYNRTIEDELGRRLGWTFEPRADQDVDEPTAIRELTGMPVELIEGFSKRRAAVERRLAELVSTYAREHGHTPPRDVQYELAQQATLEQRPAKEHAETVGEERARWRREAGTMVDVDGQSRMLAALMPAQALLLTDRDVTEDQVAGLARAALDDVTGRRSTWTVRHVQAAAQRATRELRMASPEARDAVVRRVVDMVLTPADGVSDVVRLDPPELVEAPDVLRRQSRESVFVAHATERYTTSRQLDAEDRLLGHAARTAAPRVTLQDVGAVADSIDLAGDQLDAVARLATSGRGLGLLIGPAGAGKTTTVRALVAAWKVGTGKRVHGLAPTAVAAAVLKAETGMSETETIHKWAISRDAETGGFEAGDLVVVDEAGMVGTQWLLEIAETAEAAGAKVVIVGDYRQLSAIESGGALRLLATDAPDTVAELTSVWRFADRDSVTGAVTVRQWEADASLLVRDGKVDGLEPYFEHGRVAAGAEAVLADRLYETWRAEETAGLTSLMLSASNDVVAELGRRARADLVAAGRVEAGGVPLSDGNLAGVGDIVVTRKNNRLLKAGREFVKNGDLWTVQFRHGDGSLDVRHVDHGGQVTLPADYVRERVEQGYAMTVHRAQGSTVDIAHALVDGTWSRELLYVAMTRGRLANSVHVVTDHVLDPDIDRKPDPDRIARAVLGDVLRRESGDVSATETLREAQASVDSLHTLLPRYRYAAELQAGPLARDLVQQGLRADLADKVVASTAWPALADRIGMLAERGVHVSRVLAETVEQRGLGGAEDLAAVLHARLQPVVAQSRPAVGDWLPPAPAGSGELPTYLRSMREVMDTRVRSLGATTAFERPDWAAALPPVPELDDPTREDWETLAGRVAAYREAYGVDGVDALGPMAHEPRQAEARAHLAEAIEVAARGAESARVDDAAELAARLRVARERVAAAERSAWAVEKAADEPAEAVQELRRLDAARRLLGRLDRAEDTAAAAAAATEEYVATVAEIAQAQVDVEGQRGRNRRQTEQHLARLREALPVARAERDAAVEAHADVAAALPAEDAWGAARADAVRVLAAEQDTLRRVEGERAARAAELDEQRAQAGAELAQARVEVRALEARARAAGMSVEHPSTRSAPQPAGIDPWYDEGRRSPEGNDGPELDR